MYHSAEGGRENILLLFGIFFYLFYMNMRLHSIAHVLQMHMSHIISAKVYVCVLSCSDSISNCEGSDPTRLSVSLIGAEDVKNLPSDPC